MRYSSALLTTGIFVLILMTGTSCTNISLSNPRNPQQPATSVNSAVSTVPQPSGLLPGGNAPVALTGEWEVDFTVPGGEPQASSVMLSQHGSTLAGEGADQATGLGWQIQNGQVQGTKVSFQKVYVNVDPPRPPISYVGELKYENSPEYTGWMMEGTYSVQRPDGQVISGKWISNQMPAAEEPPAANTTVQAPPSTVSPAPVQQELPDRIGDYQPTDLSGKYYVSYQYNFKKIGGHMWLEHDGGKLSGHGTDTSTNEKYVIEGGNYKYPDISFTRVYVKGKGAQANRKVIFRAKLSSDKHNIIMKGETQFGGHWDAKLARLR